MSLFLNVTLSPTPIKYYCLLTIQELLRLLLTSSPFNYFYQLLFPTPVSYFCHLLVTGSGCCSLLYQLLLLTSHFSYYSQVLLSGNIITYSYQLLAFPTFISYSYLLYSHAPIRYSYQNSFVTNHYQSLLSHTT